MADRQRASTARAKGLGAGARVLRRASVWAGEQSSELKPTGASSRPAIAAGLAGASAAAALGPSVVAALQRTVGNAAVGGLMQRWAGPPPTASAPIQAYRSVRATDGGTHVGEPSACHCHIDIGNPHFKVGNDVSTRINFGRDMSVPRMQRAYEALLAKHSGKDGFDDCKEYLEEQGCVEPEAQELSDTLKAMLLKWGGLADDKISFYTGPDGTREERPVYNVEDLNDVIVEAEDEIRYSDSIYEDFLAEEGSSLSPGHQDIDFDAMGEEANKLFEKDRKKVQG